MPKSPKEMVEAIARNLPAKTGRTFEQWVALTRKQKPASRGEAVAWLKSQHKLGTVTATFIAADATGQSIVDQYADEGKLLDAMYSGEKLSLRPVYDELTRAGRKLGKDVQLTVCKTYVGMRRARMFALVKPSTKSRVDLGLALDGVNPSGRLAKAPSSIGNDRITHVIGIASKREIDAEVRRWLKAAWEAAG
jgi:predicted transport protein